MFRHSLFRVFDVQYLSVCSKMFNLSLVGRWISPMSGPSSFTNHSPLLSIILPNNMSSTKMIFSETSIIKITIMKKVSYQRQKMVLLFDQKTFWNCKSKGYGVCTITISTIVHFFSMSKIYRTGCIYIHSSNKSRTAPHLQPHL